MMAASSFSRSVQLLLVAALFGGLLLYLIVTYQNRLQDHVQLSVALYKVCCRRSDAIICTFMKTYFPSIVFILFTFNLQNMTDSYYTIIHYRHC